MKFDLEKSFNDSLIGEELKDAVYDFSELTIDQLVSNESLKSIPIVSTVIGLMQTGANIHDKLFLKKIVVFLDNLKGIGPEKRVAMIDKIDSSKKYSIKVGEKLLYLLDSCEDHTHARNLSKLFSAMINDQISYREYLRAALIIIRISKSELNDFLAEYRIDYMDEYTSQLSYTGLVRISFSEVEVEVEKVEPGDWKDPPEYYKANTQGGHIIVEAIPAGHVIFEIFGIGKEKLEQRIAKEQEEI